MELTDLDRFNPWWKTGKVKDDLLKDYKRKLYPKIREYVDKKQILLIQGLRRVGKTVIMFQLIQNQLKKTKPNNILYFSFDEVSYDIKDVLKTYQERVLGKTFEKTKDKIYLFLDEIQKVNDWENKLKVLYDLYPNLKIFISGSSSINLRKNSRESLAGRLFSFTLNPLEFDEFLELNGMNLKKIRAKPELWKREILPMFYRYTKFGGFPELATEKNEKFARDYILNSVIEKIIYKDIPEEFNAKEPDLLKRLLYIVGKKPGMIINFKDIGRNLGKDERTIANYFEYLEQGMLVKFVFNYRVSPVATMRKLKKVYFNTPNLIFALNYSETMPDVLENVVAVKLDAKYFYRNSYEVDFIKEDEELSAIEVKMEAKKLKQLKKLSSDKSFLGKIKNKYIVDMEKECVEEGIKIIPVWKFLLDIE